MISDHPTYDDFTPEQRYLHDLGELTGPVLSAYRTHHRIARLHPRTGRIAASGNLETSGQRLAMDAYHFKVRIELFGDSAATVISDKQTREEFQSAIGRIARNFSRANKRVMKYRNFVVHGPKNRVDEFALLRGLELGGFFCMTIFGLHTTKNLTPCAPSGQPLPTN